MSSSLRIFANPDYRQIWCFGLLSGTVRCLEFLAVGIYAFEITQSPQLVALLALLRMSPFIFLGFFIGALTDIVDRKRWLIILTFIVMCVCITTALAAYRGRASYVVLAVATFVKRIYWVTDMPLGRRLFVAAIDSGSVASASTFDNITNYVTRGVGPICGGLVCQWLGIAGIFSLSAALCLICLLLALGITQRKVTESRCASQPKFATKRPIVYHRSRNQHRLQCLVLSAYRDGSCHGRTRPEIVSRVNRFAFRDRRPGRRSSAHNHWSES